MKILYYSAHPDLSTRDAAGYATHMNELVAGLEGLGHEVVMLVAGDSRGGGTGGEAATPGGSAPRRLMRRLVPGPIWQALRDLRVRRHDRESGESLRELIERGRPDVLYERAAYLCRSGARVAGSLGIPLLLEVNAPYRLERPSLGGRSLLSGLGRGWERTVLRGAARVLPVSTPLRDHLAESHGIHNDRFRIIGNAVDPKVFDPDRAGPGDRSALNIAEGSFVVGYTGGFLPWHALDRLVDAVARLRSEDLDVHALLVGDGEIRADLQARAVRHGVRDRVAFAGAVPRERVPGLVAVMDAGVIPGHEWYCSPIKLFEYGAMGKTVIAFDSAAVRDVLVPEEEGLLVGEHVDDLARAIRRVAADPVLAARLGGAIQARVRTRHTWERNAARVIEAAREAIGR